MTTNEITIQIADWARFTEVLVYAQRRDMTVPEAIVALVNSGLSHL